MDGSVAMKANDIVPEFIMLIGVPGSGKSTYIKKLKADNPDKEYVVASTDDIISAWGEAEGLNYSQAFQKFDYKKAETIFKNQIKDAIKNRKNIIVDRTNLTPKSRAKTMANLPNDYKTIAVVFDVDEKELQQRLDTRAAETGKHIPDKVVDQMKASFTPPSKSEFDHIVRVG